MKKEKPIIVNCINPEIEQAVKDFERKPPEEQLKEFYNIMIDYMNESEIAEFDKEFQELSKNYLREES